MKAAYNISDSWHGIDIIKNARNLTDSWHDKIKNVKKFKW